jgi:Ca2+-binding RTX toxin-like protein
VAGYTASTNFPTANAIDASHNGGDDAFVSKLNPSGSALAYSTYVGGTAADGAEAIAVDRASGVAYIAGGTASAGFPTTPGALQTTRSADAANTLDGFVARVNAAGSALEYSTFLGGAGRDQAAGVAIDPAGSAYVTGATASSDFPLQAPLQGTRGGISTDDDFFITKLNAAGSAAVYSTYFGGAAPDQGSGIDVDSTGAAYVSGTTEGSGNFPLTNPIGRGAGNQEAVLVKLNPAGSSAVYSTVLGGSDGDLGNAVAVGPGGAYLAGQANAYAAPPGNFPTTPGAFQAQPAGGAELFLAKVSEAPASPLVTSLRNRSGPVTGGTRVTIEGTGLSGATAVRFGGTPAASFKVESATRITAVSPARGLGRVKVTVTTPGGTTPPNPVTTFEYAEGAWTQTGSTNDAHFSAPMVLLGDGRVLLPSGMTTKAGPATPSSELYNPKTRTWTKTADIGTPRHTHTGTLLSGPACRSASRPAYCGKVLVTGGFAVGTTAALQPVLNSAELYDPGAGTWSGAGTMNARRALHAATLLDGPPCRAASPPSYCGKVLVVGGRTCDQAPPAGCGGTVRTNTAELYNPADGTWTPTGSMVSQRNNFKLGTLPDGSVVAVGGFGTNNAATTAEVYDPVADTWGSTQPLRSRSRTSAAVLPDGRVLAVSGFGANNSVDIYEPSTRLWSPAPDIGISYRFNYYYATLPSGKALFAAGTSGGETSEVFNAGTLQWTSAGLLNFAYGGAAGPSDTTNAVVLSSDPDRFAADSAECGNDCGKALVAGNVDVKAADLYTPPPRIDAVSPRGPALPGTSVTITGQGFTHNLRAVRFGSTPATRFKVDSYGRITAVAPPHAGGAVDVTVINEGGAATRTGAFIYAATYAKPPGNQPSAGFSDCPAASSNLIRGTSGPNALLGTSRGDRIFGLAGNDRADGRAGADCIDLGPGSDRAVGGSGRDLILGGTGRDRLSGGSGADRLRGGSSGDSISGGSARDRISGNGGSDRLNGNSGNDSLTGNSGRDRISGSSGNDRISGSSGSDRISGGAGGDRISGGSGNDRISARDRRRDRITCGSGRDRVTADRRDRVSRNCERVRRR